MSLSVWLSLSSYLPFFSVSHSISPCRSVCMALSFSLLCFFLSLYLLISLFLSISPKYSNFLSKSNSLLSVALFRCSLSASVSVYLGLCIFLCVSVCLCLSLSVCFPVSPFSYLSVFPASNFLLTNSLALPIPTSSSFLNTEIWPPCRSDWANIGGNQFYDQTNEISSKPPGATTRRKHSPIVSRLTDRLTDSQRGKRPHRRTDRRTYAVIKGRQDESLYRRRWI